MLTKSQTKKLRQKENRKRLEEQKLSKERAELENIFSKAKSINKLSDTKKSLKEAWLAKYKEDMVLEKHCARETWSIGKTDKKSIMDYAFNNQKIVEDIDEINEKRKENGLPLLEENDNAAKKEILSKSKRIAIAYNKGGYMFISDKEKLSDLGKKTNELE